jgi:hypothetical protein
MTRYSSQRDMTALQPTGGGGMDPRKLWMCGHHALTGERKRLGAGPVLWKCAECAKKDKA